MRDLTQQLQQLFSQYQARRRSSPANRLMPAQSSVSRAAAPKALQTFLAPVSSLGDVVSSAIQHSRARIDEALGLLDDCAESELTASLLLAEAELLSASVGVKNMQQSVKAVADQPLNLAERLVLSHPSGTSSASVLCRAGDLFRHLEEVLSVLESRVAQERLRAALCREEVELYQSQMRLFSGGWCSARLPEDSGNNTTTTAAGGSTFQQSLMPRTRDPDEDIKRRTGASLNGAQTADNDWLSCSSPAQPPPPSSSAAHIFRAALKTEQLLKDGVASATGSVFGILRATSAVAVGSTGVAGGARLLSSLASGVGVASSVPVAAAASSSRGKQNCNRATEAAQEFYYTEEEIELFQERNQQLLIRQQQNASHDAKQVENSVRELSQLTSLMSEMVLQQSEQIGILVKNTDESQKNIQNVARELKKPLATFWTPSKQLILLLWVATAVVLVAHHMVR